MYSPYDQYLENFSDSYDLQQGWSSKESYFTPAKMFMGATLAVGALGLGVGLGTTSHFIEKNMRQNNPAYKARMEKFANSEIYKGTTHLREFSKFYRPHYREVNALDKGFYGMFKKTPGKGGFPASYLGRSANMSTRRMLSLPVMAPALAMLSMTSEIEQMGSGGLAVGAVRAGLTEGGALVGLKVGATAGLFVGGPGGAFVGGIAGMMVGGTVGAGVVDAISWMKSKGRQWSLPDLGGSFRDSQMGQTMRQRSLNAISQSQFNVRSSLGREGYYLNFGY